MDSERLEIQIMQMVRLMQDGKEVKMSKRTGNAITLREIMDEVGVDAARYFLTMRSPDTHFDFDMELAKQESQDNPVYYAQYAHARICSILRQAAERGITPSKDADYSLITNDKAIDLLKKLLNLRLQYKVLLRIERHIELQTIFKIWLHISISFIMLKKC